VKSVQKRTMSTKKAKRKRAATPVAAVVVEDAKPLAPSQPTIVLASNCNVKDAGELKQSLCYYLDDGEPVALDIGKVERIDTSTMQLLCAFVRDRTARERKVEWVGDAHVIRDAARLLGVEDLLCLPGVAP
jgi:ABC-type transporter Mla MlaB component